MHLGKKILVELKKLGHIHVSTSTVMKVLAASRPSVIRWVRAGLIPTTKSPGKVIKFLIDELILWIENGMPKNPPVK